MYLNVLAASGDVYGGVQVWAAPTKLYSVNCSFPLTLLISHLLPKARFVDKKAAELDETNPDALVTEDQTVIETKDEMKQLTIDAVTIFFALNKFELNLKWFGKSLPYSPAATCAA